MKKLLFVMAMCLIAGVAAFPSAANATLTLSLSDGINTIVIDDGSGLDKNDATGAVTFIGNIGLWTFNVSTGFSKPNIGSLSSAQMDLNSVDISSSGAGALTIKLYDNSFNLPAGSGVGTMLIGGTQDNGNVTLHGLL